MTQNTFSTIAPFLVNYITTLILFCNMLATLWLYFFFILFFGTGTAFPEMSLVALLSAAEVTAVFFPFPGLLAAAVETRIR